MNAGESTSRKEERSDGADGEFDDFIGIHCSSELKRRLKKVALDETEIDDTVSLSDVVRRALERELDRVEQRGQEE